MVSVDINIPRVLQLPVTPEIRLHLDSIFRCVFAQAEVKYSGLRHAQPRMEEAFISLIQKQTK